MKMTMLLLVSAVALLVSPGVASPTPHKAEYLKHIIELAEKFNTSHTEEIFVENVKPLVDDGCKDRFFCKVYDILCTNSNLTHRKDAAELARNLRKYNGAFKVNCTELLRELAPTSEEIQLPSLMSFLKSCAQKRNFSGANQSNP